MLKNLSKEVIKQAIHTAFMALFESDIMGWCQGNNRSGSYGVIIMNPEKTKDNSTFEDAVLYKEIYGKGSRKFLEKAIDNAKHSWLSGQDSMDGLFLVTSNFITADNMLTGSINRNGLVVAFSGFDPAADIFMCEVIIANLTAIIRHNHN